MKVGIIGRTASLLEAAQLVLSEGHEIVCVVTSKEAPEYTSTAEDFRSFAASLQVPFMKSPSDSELEQLMRATKPDVALSVNYTSVISKLVIDQLPLGILNAHGGDLPRYRGNACQAWAIINGEDRIGLCIHKMVGGELDSGDIIARKFLKIDLSTKIGAVLTWMRQEIPLMMRDVLEVLSVNPEFILEKQPDDLTLALRCYPRQPVDGKIEWKLSSTEILRLINASGDPFPGAFCTFEQKKVTVLDAEIVDDDEVLMAVPGQIVKIGDSFVDVACGSGKLRLLSVCIEPEGLVPKTLFRSIRQRFQ